MVANIAAYTQGVPWLESVIEYLAGNRRVLKDLVQEHLPQARWVMPVGTYLAFIDYRDLEFGDFAGTPTDFFADNARVTLPEGGLCGDAGAGWIRLNFATPTHILRRIVEQMGATVA